MIFTLPSTFIIITTVIVLSVFYIAYKYYLRPYLLVKYYEKQGGVGFFYWNLLRHFENKKCAEEKGDYYYIDKEIIRKNPNARFIVENCMSKAVIILNDLEMIKEYLRKGDVYQKERELLTIIMGMAPEFTLFIEDEAWKRKRKIISAAFNFDFLKDVVPKIVDVGKEKFSEWIANGELKDQRLYDKISTITSEVIARFFFGKRASKYTVQGLQVSAALQKLSTGNMVETSSLPCIIFGPSIVKKGLIERHRKLHKLNEEIRECCKKMIEETEQNFQGENNLLSSLLKLKHSDKKEYELTNDQVVDEFIGLFLAGTDTTANLVSSSIYFLWKYPRVFEKVSEEVNREFVNVDNITIDNLNKMEYTTAFLKEVLRLGGPVAATMTRRAVKDDDLCGVKIKKGTRVLIRQTIHLDSEKYFPNSKEICPERWLPNSPYNQDAVKNNPYAFIPFLSGPRNCVGQHLAIIEAKITLGLFIKTFKFSFPENYQFKMTQKFGYVPLHPYIVTLELKNCQSII